jgi:hypothetical protein
MNVLRSFNYLIENSHAYGSKINWNTPEVLGHNVVVKRLNDFLVFEIAISWFSKSVVEYLMTSSTGQ